MGVELTYKRIVDLSQDAGNFPLDRLIGDCLLLDFTHKKPNEAVAVGVCGHLTDSDYITSTHRGHGHCMDRGADMNAVMAEMFAKTTGCCKGLGGSMHIADFNVGMLGANGIVGAGIPIATGGGPPACMAQYSCHHGG